MTTKIKLVPPLRHGENSWVIVDKVLGKAVAEFYNAATVAKINRAKYVAIPAWKYLASLNKNPVPPSSKSLTRQLETGISLGKRFSGHTPEVVARIKKPEIPDVAVVIGYMDGILYTTVRDGATEKYIHKFHSKSRPLFCVSPDGKSMWIVGGQYTFTERGIVDTDTRGREIE